MRFTSGGQFTDSEADIDPVAAPETALGGHILRFKDDPTVVLETPNVLSILLLGTGVETLTLDLYFLVESLDRVAQAKDSNVIATGQVWVQFATGQVVTNGTLLRITAGLPNRGLVYARRTADTLAAPRQLLAAWG